MHERHSSLEAAKVCFGELTRQYTGSIPVHPISQQFIYKMIAIDRKGNQRNYTRDEREEARKLNLDLRSYEPDLPGITTFYRMAYLYYEALKQSSLTTVNLNGLVDRSSRSHHFWSTDAGIGQALFHVQHALLTLEFALKAYLEGLGKIGTVGKEDRQKIRTHELKRLFNLLTADEKQRLEKDWSSSDIRRNYFRRTFQELLLSYNKQYEKWRYVTDLTATETKLIADLPLLVGASEFLLSASLHQLKERSPYSVHVTVTTSTVTNDGDMTIPSVTTMVGGTVRSVVVPDSYDPQSRVKVLIDSHQHDQPISVYFFKRDAGHYYGLEGEHVSLFGEISEDQPYLLKSPEYLEPPKRPQSYTSERLTLFGSIYDMRIVYPPFGLTKKIALSLYDKTFFTQVECFFVTDQERDYLRGFNLGDHILIGGLVTLLNGVPMLLIGPHHIEEVTEPVA